MLFGLTSPLLKILTPGKNVYITGKVDRSYGATQLAVEDYEVTTAVTVSAGRLVLSMP